MSDLKIFWIELIAGYKRNFRSNEGTVSNVVTLFLAIIVAGLLIWVASSDITNYYAQVIFYLLAMIELLLGMRVGMLRVGSRNDEYMISIASRFWRRSFSYLIPAVLLPLPIIAITSYKLLGYSWAGALTLVNSLIILLAFMSLGVVWGIVVRRITKRVIFRSIVLILSVIGAFSLIDSANLLFQTLVSPASVGLSIALLVFGLATIVISLSLTDLLLGNLALVDRGVGRFLPIATGSGAIGFAHGSSNFFLTAKTIFRDSHVQRRLAAVVFVYLLIAGLGIASQDSLGSNLTLNLGLSTFAIFTAAVSYIIGQSASSQIANKENFYGYLINDRQRLVIGGFIGGLMWQMIISAILWGILGLWIGSQGLALSLVIVVFSQYLLAFGWAQKLQQADHQAISTVTIYGLLVLVGLIPSLLWLSSGAKETVFIQLIWLIFIGILLQTTNPQKEAANYA